MPTGVLEKARGSRSWASQLSADPTSAMITSAAPALAM